jgi:hypothetical protein
VSNTKKIFGYANGVVASATPAALTIEEQIMALTPEQKIERLRKALKPFSDAVFNDNGDVTVDHSVATHDDYWNAYCAMRATEK